MRGIRPIALLVMLRASGAPLIWLLAILGRLWLQDLSKWIGAGQSTQQQREPGFDARYVGIVRIGWARIVAPLKVRQESIDHVSSNAISSAHTLRPDNRRSAVAGGVREVEPGGHADVARRILQETQIGSPSARRPAGRRTGKSQQRWWPIAANCRHLGDRRGRVDGARGGTEPVLQ